MFIEVNNISFSFNDKKILNNLSFYANRGESVSIIGKNGVGKSTFLKILAGQLVPSAGTLTIGGVSPCLYTFAVMLPQNYRLIEHKTLVENLKLPLKLRGFSNNDATEIAIEQLKCFDLYKFADYYPYQLSEGVLRRGAIAEVGLFKSDLLLLDEPFCNIDCDSADYIYQYLTSRRLDGTTIILVTHNETEAETLTERDYILCEDSIMSL